jgi:pimeloyl-ACP methyl ester carboxylesterase
MDAMTEIVALPGGRTASYTIIGNGRPALMFAGGPGFTAAYMTGDAELLSGALHSHLIDPHGSGSSTPPADPAAYSPEGTARFYEEVRQALGLPPLVVLGHSFGATTALTYAALFPESTTACIAVAGFGIGPEADAGQGGARRRSSGHCCSGIPTPPGTPGRGRSWTSGPSAYWRPPIRPRWSR